MPDPGARERPSPGERRWAATTGTAPESSPRSSRVRIGGAHSRGHFAARILRAFVRSARPSPACTYKAVRGRDQHLRDAPISESRRNATSTGIGRSGARVETLVSRVHPHCHIARHDAWSAPSREALPLLAPSRATGCATRPVSKRQGFGTRGAGLASARASPHRRQRIRGVPDAAVIAQRAPASSMRVSAGHEGCRARGSGTRRTRSDGGGASSADEAGAASPRAAHVGDCARGSRTRIVSARPRPIIWRRSPARRRPRSRGSVDASMCRPRCCGG